MIALLDVNVLVALAWPNHVHHAGAHQWFAGWATGWATTPMTETGFVRVSANANALPVAARPVDAFAILTRMTGLPKHHFWIDDVRTVVDDFVAPTRVLGHQQVTDAHLVALAIRHAGTVASFDKGIRSLVDRKHTAHVLTIPS